MMRTNSNPLETPQKDPAARRFGLPHMILLLGLSILLVSEIYFGYRLHALSAEQEKIKEDYSMSNNITFGIFSVDQWRDRIAGVINPQVEDFTMTAAQKKTLRKQVEQQLHGLINKTIAEINKPQKSLGGKLKKFAFNSMVNADEIQAQVPSFAKTIIDKVNSPASQRRLKGIASGKLQQLEKQTYDSTSTANFEVTKYLYKKYHVSDPVAYNKEINSRLAAIRTVTYNYAFAMLGCVAFAAGLWLLMRKYVHLHTVLFIMSLLFAFVLLIVGVTASIIELDARISSLDFMLMGQKVSFQNQVLFFQSKSLFGVVETLIGQSKPDAIVVGSLIFLFVIVLPILRMTARGIHILSNKSFAENKVVRYLAFDSGKWDMADVMVVGILMTYIGLNGILKSQLSGLNMRNGSLNIITENNTSLQPGYFIFMGYVIFAAILSYVLKRITPHQTK
ncbi:MAG: paraquat-inducible protein A [Bacteroidota bacterium]